MDGQEVALGADEEKEDVRARSGQPSACFRVAQNRGLPAHLGALDRLSRRLRDATALSCSICSSSTGSSLTATFLGLAPPPARLRFGIAPSGCLYRRLV